MEGGRNFLSPPGGWPLDCREAVVLQQEAHSTSQLLSGWGRERRGNDVSPLGSG